MHQMPWSTALVPAETRMKKGFFKVGCDLKSYKKGVREWGGE